MLRSIYPVGPLLSDLRANAKKALEFKAFEVSVSARARFTLVAVGRVCLRRVRIIMRLPPASVGEDGARVKLDFRPAARLTSRWSAIGGGRRRPAARPLVIAPAPRPIL